jgi:glycosyltransferase involved in cell wall biosynthesis
VWNEITAIILTHNEEVNIGRTVARVTPARQILVIDSGSTDRTIDILREFSNARVEYRAFDDFASQCNFALSLVRTPMVLSIDADYELSTALIDEIAAIRPDQALCGYRARFIYRVLGRSLRGSLYPPRCVLYRRDLAHYRNEGHGHRVHINGEVGLLTSPIFHDDRKPLSRFLTSQQQYARREAEHLLVTDKNSLKSSDRLRLAIVAAPFAVPIFVLLFRGCLLDGWPGWYYTMQRLLAEVLISLELLDRRIRSQNQHSIIGESENTRE